jgi:hypothetical protein
MAWREHLEDIGDGAVGQPITVRNGDDAVEAAVLIRRRLKDRNNPHVVGIGDEGLAAGNGVNDFLRTVATATGRPSFSCPCAMRRRRLSALGQKPT